MLIENDDHYSFNNLEDINLFNDLEAFISKKKNYLLSIIEKNLNQKEREMIFNVIKILNDIQYLIQTIVLQDTQNLNYSKQSIKTIKLHLIHYIEKNIDLEIVFKSFC